MASYASDAALEKLFGSFLELHRDNDGWEFVTEKRGVSVERKYFGDDGVATLRGVGTVAAPWRSVMDLLTKPERRQEWDLFYETGHHVKRFDENTGLGYVKTKSYTMVWPRDFSVLASGRLLPDDGGFIFAGHSVVDEELIPTDSSCVRGTVHIAGFHVVPVAGNPSESIITYIFKIDAAGWVPSSLSNMVNNYQPLSIIGIRKVLTGSPAHPPGSDQ